MLNYQNIITLLQYNSEVISEIAKVQKAFRSRHERGPTIIPPFTHYTTLPFPSTLCYILSSYSHLISRTHTILHSPLSLTHTLFCHSCTTFFFSISASVPTPFPWLLQLQHCFFWLSVALQVCFSFKLLFLYSPFSLFFQLKPFSIFHIFNYWIYL